MDEEDEDVLKRIRSRTNDKRVVEIDYSDKINSKTRELDVSKA